MCAFLLELAPLLAYSYLPTYFFLQLGSAILSNLKSTVSHFALSLPVSLLVPGPCLYQKGPLRHQYQGRGMGCQVPRDVGTIGPGVNSKQLLTAANYQQLTADSEQQTGKASALTAFWR